MVWASPLELLMSFDEYHPVPPVVAPPGRARRQEGEKWDRIPARLLYSREARASLPAVAFARSVEKNHPSLTAWMLRSQDWETAHAVKVTGASRGLILRELGDDALSAAMAGRTGVSTQEVYEGIVFFFSRDAMQRPSPPSIRFGALQRVDLFGTDDDLDDDDEFGILGIALTKKAKLKKQEKLAIKFRKKFEKAKAKYIELGGNPRNLGAKLSAASIPGIAGGLASSGIRGMSGYGAHDTVSKCRAGVDPRQIDSRKNEVRSEFGGKKRMRARKKRQSFGVLSGGYSAGGFDGLGESVAHAMFENDW